MVSTIRKIPARIQAMIIPAITPPPILEDDEEDGWAGGWNISLC